ncbi:MAG: hypothetical protein ACOYOS_16705 [Syntrophales bacterium]
MYDKALGDIGVTLVGSPFRRGEEGVTASIFDSIAFLATLEKDLRALDLMLVSSIVPIASKHAPHGGDDAKLPDARIAVKNYRGEET